MQHPIQIYFPASGKEFFEHIRGVSSYYDVAFIEPHPIEQDGIVFSDQDLTIKALHLDHTIETFGYRIEERNSVNIIQMKLDTFGIAGPSVGILKATGKITHDGKTIHLEDVSKIRKGQSFAFVLDTRMCEAAITLAQDVDLLVTESTFLGEDEDKAFAHGHLTATQAAEIARQANAGMLLLTHFSQRYGVNADFASEARVIHPDVIQMNDKDTFELLRPPTSLV